MSFQAVLMGSRGAWIVEPIKNALDQELSEGKAEDTDTNGMSFGSSPLEGRQLGRLYSQR